MFEKFTGADANDFRQRYQGTYGFFLKGGKRILVSLDSITTEDVKQVNFSDKDGVKYRLRADSEDDSVGFEFIPPRNSYHNTTQGTFLLRRTPSRQYSRGVCDRNTVICTAGGHQVSVNFEYLSLLFGEVLSPRSIIEKIKEGQWPYERSVALSSQFAVHLDHNTVYCLGLGIGTASLDEGTIKVKLTDPDLWQTELRDCFNRTQIQGTVE